MLLASFQTSRGEGGFGERSKSMDWAVDEMVKRSLHLCGVRDTLGISPRRSLAHITTGLDISSLCGYD